MSGGLSNAVIKSKLAPGRCYDKSGAGLHFLLDEDHAYTSQLQSAGVEVTHVEFDGAIHAFDLDETPSSIAF